MLMVSMRVPSCPFVTTVFVRVSAHREQVAGKHQENKEKRRNVSADPQERQDEEQEQRQRATEQHPQAMSLHTFLVTLRNALQDAAEHAGRISASGAGLQDPDTYRRQRLEGGDIYKISGHR